MQDICAFTEAGLGSALLLISGVAALATAMIIGISYMVGKTFSNPKVHLWAKTEMLQLFISVASVGIIIIILQSFCVIDLSSLRSLVDSDPTFSTEGLGSGSMNVFQSAEAFLVADAKYTHTIMEIERYHLMSYNMLMLRSRYDCVFGPLLCMFGNAGTSNAPYSFASLSMGAMNVAFSTTMLSYMSTLIAIFILFYVRTGFALFLIPLGIFFRSMPYLRSLGSLFITVAFAFIIVFPTILAIFNIIGPYLFMAGFGAFIDQSVLVYANPQIVVDNAGGGSAFANAWDYGSDNYDEVFFFAGNKEPIVIQLAGRAFVTGTFMPLVALLATVASVSSIAKVLGEEIDLSRIVRMV